MMKSGIRIRIEAFPPLLCVALTFLWMIVMTNGFNLIDVMDGLAAGVATVSALALAVVFVFQGNRMGLILCLSLVGALIGFLRYNRPPAQIYLGDTGSLLIGFLLGGLAIEGDYTARNPYGWFTALAVFAVPLFEIVFVSWLRFRRGASIFSGSRDHFSLRLRRWKLTRGQTVSASCGAAAVAAWWGCWGWGWPLSCPCSPTHPSGSCFSSSLSGSRRSTWVCRRDGLILDLGGGITGLAAARTLSSAR